MASKRELPSERQNPLEFLNGRDYVLADTFIVRINDSSDKEAEEKVRTSLSGQGITDPVTIIFCNSEEKRIEEIINSLKNKKALSASDNPWMGIVGFNANQLQNMFEALSIMFIQEDPIVQDINANNVVIFLLNAKYPTKKTLVDQRTGLRLVALQKGGSVFPMHPTPAD